MNSRSRDEDTEPNRVSAGLARDWLAACERLAPVVGEQAVLLLYRRSLLVNRRSFAWLEAALEPARAGRPEDIFSALDSALARQSAGDAAKASHALWSTFIDSLGAHIGAGLTQRLLASLPREPRKRPKENPQ